MRIKITINEELHQAIDAIQKKRGNKSWAGTLLELANERLGQIDKPVPLPEWGGNRDAEYQHWLRGQLGSGYDPYTDQEGEYSYEYWKSIRD